MSPSEIVTTLLRHADEGDFEAFRARLHADCEWVNPMAQADGADEAVQAIAAYAAPFPERRHELSLVVERRDTVALEGEWVATHARPLATPEGEVPPTGRTVRVPFAAVVRLRDGRVASAHIQLDPAGFMAQLGPAADAAALVDRVRQVFESGEAAALSELVAPDADIRNPFTTVHGPEGFAELARQFAGDFAERRIEVLDVVQSGDAAVAQIRVSARHVATGNEVSFDETSAVRLRGGRIGSWHSYYDTLALARQLELERAL